jgi:HEAT repeat protein
LRTLGPKAIDQLVAALRTSEHSDIRAGAALALSWMKSSRSVEPLIEALRDPSPKVRSRAALALGSAGSSAALVPLIRLLDDPEPEARASACSALGHFTGDVVFEQLIEHLRREESPMVRLKAARALGHLGDGRAFDLLLQTMQQDPNWLVRGAAASSLARIDEQRAVEPLLAALSLKDAPPPEDEGKIRRVTEQMLDAGCEPMKTTREYSEWDQEREHFLTNVVYALTNLGEPRALEPVIEMLNDENPAIRRVAARTLGNLRDQRAVEPLLRAAEDDDPRVSRNAIESLGRLGHPRGGRTLQTVDAPEICAKPGQRTRQVTARALHQRPGGMAEIPAMLESDDPEARAVGLLALGLQGKWSDLETITRFLDDPETAVRASAVEALANLREPRMQLLVATLGNRQEDSEVRAAAARAIGDLGRSQIPFHLMAALQDDDANIRSEAARALGNSPNQYAMRQLVTALDDEDGGVRAAAAESLGRQRYSRAFPALLARTEDPDIMVRGMALTALGSLGDERAVEPVLRILEEESQEMVLGAILALGQLGDPRAVDPLLEQLDNTFTRHIALQALAGIPDQRAIETVIAAFDSDDSGPQSSQLANRLAELGEPALAPLIDALTNPSVGIRRRALQALGWMRDEAALEALTGVLSGDEDEVIRAFAASFLAWSDDDRAVAPLIDALGDPSHGVREAAAGSLGALADQRAVTPLAAVLQDPSMEVRTAALMPLAHLGGPEAANHLLAALGDDEDEIRRLAALALCYMAPRDPRADQAFAAALEARDLSVIAGAYAWLVEQGDEAHIPLLVEALEAHGEGEMARDLAMCGNERLAEAARRWAEAQQPPETWRLSTSCFLCPRWVNRQR